MRTRAQDELELELRLRHVLADTERVDREELDARDYRNLLLVCVALPVALLVVGWFL